MENRGKTCSSRSNCNNIRECNHCAQERQGRIAGVAEEIEKQYGQLTMTVIKPEQNTSAAIRAVHASFLRRALTPAGIWTIETGELFNGLHINILSPEIMAARWKGCKTYSEAVRTTARDAAAYISKRSGMPALEQYNGRLYGAFGKIGEMLVDQEHYPVVQAAAVELVLSGKRPEPVPSEPAERIDISLDTRRDVMRRHLPNLYKAVRRQ